MIEKLLAVMITGVFCALLIGAFFETESMDTPALVEARERAQKEARHQREARRACGGDNYVILDEKIYCGR